MRFVKTLARVFLTMVFMYTLTCTSYMVLGAAQFMLLRDGANINGGLTMCDIVLGAILFIGVARWLDK